MRTIHLCLWAAFLNLALAAWCPSFSAEEQPAPNRNSCKSAADCRGGLPTFSKMCSNSIPAHPHWACVRAQCVKETCAPENQ
jgi:hypothetical protein